MKLAIMYHHLITVSIAQLQSWKISDFYQICHRSSREPVENAIAVHLKITVESNFPDCGNTCLKRNHHLIDLQCSTVRHNKRVQSNNQGMLCILL